MPKVEVNVKITVDTKIAEDMLNCAGYHKFKTGDKNEIVSTLLSMLNCYGATAEIINIKEKE